MIGRAELLRDLRWLLDEMDKLAGDNVAPPYGPAMLTGQTATELIRSGQTVGLSRRYIEAIVAELED